MEPLGRPASVSVSVCLCLYLSVAACRCLSVSLSACLSVCLSVSLSLCLSVSLSLCLSCFSACLFVCLSIYLYLFLCLSFAFLSPSLSGSIRPAAGLSLFRRFFKVQRTLRGGRRSYHEYVEVESSCWNDYDRYGPCMLV